jgi:hypothetical protein
MENVWAALHFQEGEQATNLGDYSGIQSNADVIVALKEGFSQEQGLFHSLKMHASKMPRGKVSAAIEENWLTKPWLAEGLDPRHLEMPTWVAATSGEDGDGECIRDELAQQLESTPLDVTHVDTEVVDDGGDSTAILEEEAQHVVANMLDNLEGALDTGVDTSY